jgi:hypothetical protein
VQFESGSDATITIYGTNFGSNSSDVHVVLRLSLGGEAPCVLQGPVSDKEVVCTLPARKGRKHEGALVVSVGSDWSGGQQNTTTGVLAKIKEFDPPAKVTLVIKKDISEIPPGSQAEQQFVATFAADVAKAVGIKQERIRVTGIQAGSILVEFIILPDATSITTASPASLAANIAQQAANPSVSYRVFCYDMKYALK